jgi:hypothetical protein
MHSESITTGVVSGAKRASESPVAQFLASRWVSSW